MKGCFAGATLECVAPPGLGKCFISHPALTGWATIVPRLTALGPRPVSARFFTVRCIAHIPDAKACESFVLIAK